MRFQVPQFIEVEDKILGPLTIKQFLFIAAGCGLAFIFWRLLPTVIAFPLIAVSIASGLALAFYKINNRPLIFTIEAAFKYYISSKFYSWKQPKAKTGSLDDLTSGFTPSTIPAISNSKLKDISFNIEVVDKKNELQTGHDRVEKNKLDEFIRQQPESTESVE